MVDGLRKALRALAVPAMLSFGSGGFAAGPADVPKDWVQMPANTPFTLMLPPGTAYQRERGIDAVGGTFEGREFRIQFDYGLYSDPLAPSEKMADYQVRDARIDGKAARIVTARAPALSPASPYFMGVHFPEVGTSGMGPLKLTVVAWVGRREDYGLVERIFATLRFKAPPTQQ